MEMEMEIDFSQEHQTLEAREEEFRGKHVLVIVPAYNEGPRQNAYLMGGTGNIDFPVTTENEQAQAFFGL